MSARTHAGKQPAPPRGPAPADPAGWFTEAARRLGQNVAARLPILAPPGGAAQCRRWRVLVLRTAWRGDDAGGITAALLDLADAVLDGLRGQAQACRSAMRRGDEPAAIAACTSASAAAQLVEFAGTALVELLAISPAALRALRCHLQDELSPHAPAPLSARVILQREVAPAPADGQLDLFSAPAPRFTET